MHYLVTGGCGFIGSHLVERLLADGHRVTVIDDLSTGKREYLPASAHVIEADITTPGLFGRLLDGIDGCFHLAAIASVQRSKEDMLRTHQVNVSGTVALFDAIARQDKKIPVVFASSAAIYGDCKILPIQETMLAEPLSSYGVDKLACELYARIATCTYGIPSIGLRFFNVYGPRQDPSSPYSGVISIFAARMRAHQPVTIFGDGEQSRDFIHVTDIVRGMLSAMHALETATLVHGIFNICAGLGTSINRLADSMKTLIRSQSVITYAAAREGDIRHSLGDPALSRKHLGFAPVVAFADGLQSLLNG